MWIIIFSQRNDKQMEVLQFLNVLWVRFIMHIEMH